MQLFEDVYLNYPATRLRGGLVPWANHTPDLHAVRVGLPDLMTRFVSSSGRSLEDFRIYGSVGEPNRSFAKIPWVAICDRRVSTSTTRGYYVVLLFHEEMRGCYLSLNQGFTQFEKAYPTEALALHQVEASARRCLDFLKPAPSFVAGWIDLGASRPLGEGYERGAIVSSWYPREISVEEDHFGADLKHLLDQYQQLITFIGPNLTLNLSPASESAFQDAATKLASSKGEWQSPPPGPVPVPTPVPGSKSTRYPRDAKVCGRALKLAEFRCEADPTHLTFISRKSRENFVESHHLVPMSLQGQFSVSLDVVENVVALCPTCHRMLHHGRRGPKGPILRRLFKDREVGLQGRGIVISVDRLVDAYSRELENED